MLRNLVFLFFLFTTFEAFSQGSTCATATLLTTSTTPTCTTYSTTASTGGSVCTGAGFGGSGFNNWFKICTNSSASCIELDLTPITLTGAQSFQLYSVCGGTLVAGQNGSNTCFNTTGTTTWTSAGLSLAPNTCYYLNIWTKNSGTFSLCSKSLIKPNNDECSGATNITTTPISANNYCYTPALTDPAPATTFAFLDATTVLSRALTELGIYPAVDPLDSTSRILDPTVVG